MNRDVGDQFIEPYGFSGSLPLFCHYVKIVFVCSAVENKLVVEVYMYVLVYTYYNHQNHSERRDCHMMTDNCRSVWSTLYSSASTKMNVCIHTHTVYIQ